MSHNERNGEAPPAAESAALARIRKARRERLRLDEAWQQVHQFLPADETEEEVLELLTEVLCGAERWCNPGESATVEEFEEAQECVQSYLWYFRSQDPDLPLDLIAAVMAAGG